MTSIDLDAIRARLDAATPGPWLADYTEIISDPNRDWVAESLDNDDPAKGRANAEFIAHARQDIPDLLAEIDRLNAALTAERERIAQALLDAALTAERERIAQALLDAGRDPLQNLAWMYPEQAAEIARAAGAR